MKAIISVMVFLISQAAMADGPCVSLQKYVGSYRQISKTCDDQFKFLGPALEVAPYTETQYSGYWIRSNGVGFGPTTSDSVGDVDKCTTSGTSVFVEISANDTTGTALPAKGRITYQFTASTVVFTADGCAATYAK